ncbi:MAG TPA: NAD-glutamate dehydrogenase [Dongiaceae bacterium]|nr:NAD-glutamate dehydrogenase [Dongiaceae bacterium]
MNKESHHFIIAQLKELAKEKLGQDRAAQMEPLLAHLYGGLPRDVLEHERPDNLLGAAQALWNFIQKRPNGQPKIRVYNPVDVDDGWRSNSTVIEIVNDDMPFLVDSITGEINRQELSVQLILHPIMTVERDAGGTLVALGGAQGKSESVMQWRISPIVDAARRAALGQDIEKVLFDVRVAVEDWKKMRERLRETVQQIAAQPSPFVADEIAEAVDFLRWIDDDHFTYLGYREYRFSGSGDQMRYTIAEDRGLGVLRDPNLHVFDGLHVDKIPPHVLAFLTQPSLLMVAKANLRSKVHRNAYLDTFGTKVFDAEGRVIGERLFAGLFTSVAYNRSPWDIPLLRRRVENVVRQAGFAPSSHNAKALVHILETYPRDELFQSDDSELLQAAMGILHLQESQRVALFVRRDPFDRFLSCLVYVPRDRVNAALNKRIGQILETAFNGRISVFTPHFTESLLVRLHFIVTAQGEIPVYDPVALEAAIAEASRSWNDRLLDALRVAKGESHAEALFKQFSDAFPLGYEEDFNSAIAVYDIDHILKALATGTLEINLYKLPEAQPHEVFLKLYQRGAKIALTNVLPALENFGLNVISENSYAVHPAGQDNVVWLHDFTMASADGSEIVLDDVRAKFREAFDGVWHGRIEDDGFNRLLFTAGLGHRDVTLLRAYCKYLRQAGIAFSQQYMEATLNAYGAITLSLVNLFNVMFDPDWAGARDVRAQEIGKSCLKALDKVSNLDEDRILRRFLNAVQATLRTNYFQRDDAGNYKEYISFKLDSHMLEELPLPRPMVEVWVYSPRVEAIHLRGGKVARGGIRWSDRREDFRTEILGLMKAQMVKNSVIVPVGSKGGFVVKRPVTGERDQVMAEVVHCYKILMHGLLDITDNLVAGQVVTPAAVVRRDGDDPYLVVAADKGTATFSDIANGVSQEHQFWLGDAFASGGSAGYDHKKMGITARGAWECVKRHFRELGVDIQARDFTVVGVGDMSGDVFGNGMLQSPHIRLIGAFNHQHIFVDPNPDPRIGFAERKRLFALPRSSWADYDPAALSPGGAIFERKTKSLALSEEIRVRFGLEKAQVTPNELIRAMLKAECDLLWFGGIGTYVKAMGESHADVGDRANDAVRINGGDLRCKVIGEGANLGATQRGRIEAALSGKKLNTDAVDNSAGVDCSDHEVNIKILLNDIVASGALTIAQRDQLLAAMTDEVGALVLRDNYLQSQAISMAEAQSYTLIDQQRRFMHSLERTGKLDRTIEFLPDDETMRQRLAQRIGLTRPENAVLLAYAKMALYEELLAGDFPDDPQMVEDLITYFPAPLREIHRDKVERHRLRREIIATVATNSLVNRAGPTFAHVAKEKTSLDASAIARAYVIARMTFRLRDLWSGIEALDAKVSADAQTQMLLDIQYLLDQATIWHLRNGTHPLDVAANIARYESGIAELEEALPHVLSTTDRDRLAERATELGGQGVPESLAGRVAALSFLVNGLDIARLAQESKHGVIDTARTYFLVGDQFQLDWLRKGARTLIGDSHWQRMAVFAIIEDMVSQQYALTSAALRNDRGLTGQAALDELRGQRMAAINRVEQLFAELKQAAKLELAMLAVANRAIRSLIG